MSKILPRLYIKDCHNKKDFQNKKDCQAGRVGAKTNSRLLTTPATLLALLVILQILPQCGSREIKPPLRKEGSVVFTYKHSKDPEQPERPENVYIAGNFNDWVMYDPNFKLQWDSLEQEFMIRLKLTPGIYKYKYIIDGNWRVDPEAEEKLPDPLGGRLAIIKVVPRTNGAATP